MSKELTGYPSIDKPWLKYYSEEAINAKLPECSLYEYLYEQNKDHLNDTALNYFGKKVTYKKLFESIDNVAAALQANGVKKGDIVSVCTLAAPETVLLLYAINKVGAISNWLGLNSPVQDLHEQLRSTECKLVFAVEMAYNLIIDASKGTKIEKIVSIPIEYSMPTAMKAAASLKQNHLKLNGISVKWKAFLEKANDYSLSVSVDSNDTAVIMYTGGSTGIPKGVMWSNKGIIAAHIQAELSLKWIDYCRRDKFLCVLPPFIGFGIVSGINNPLCSGLENILFPDPDYKHIVSLMNKYHPNHTCCSPLHINEIVKKCQNNNMDLSYLKTMIYGGEIINSAWENSCTEVLLKNGARIGIRNGYGMTETAGAFAVQLNNNGGNVPYAGNNVLIIDSETNEELPYNQEGELFIATPTLMQGYYKKEKHDEFVTLNNKEWLRTGDIAKMCPNGELFITGRVKRIYWNSSSRIYPMRIEEVLLTCKNVDNCAVVGIKDGIKGYSTVAFVKPNAELLKSELDNICREKLPESHIPDKYIFVNEFPLTRGGKIDYQALEKMADKM